ncbi:hypothetical protein AB1Y20_021295 [Prymnesium parvum]|uniref:Cyclic nucleotide-binding domain-containing protein n=1 Tax=Prymnesium parvum TaxID=97485 RepID=A0AB34JK77_PRYPA
MSGPAAPSAERSNGEDAAPHADPPSESESLEQAIIALKMSLAEKDMELLEARNARGELEAALSEAREELSKVNADLSVLVVQKSELLLENWQLREKVNSLTGEKLQIREELHDCLQAMRQPIAAPSAAACALSPIASAASAVTPSPPDLNLLFAPGALLAGCSHDTITESLSLLEPRPFVANEPIVTQNEPASFLAVILRGSLTGDGISYGPGDVVGGREFFLGGRRPVSLFAETDGVALVASYLALAHSAASGRPAAKGLIDRLAVASARAILTTGSGVSSGASAPLPPAAAPASSAAKSGSKTMSAVAPDALQTTVIGLTSKLKLRNWTADPPPNERFVAMRRTPQAPLSQRLSEASHASDEAAVALFEAAVRDATATVRLLLSQRVSPDAHRSRYGMTALMAAASFGHAEVCSLLLAAGANKTLRNDCRETAHDIARMCDQPQLLSLLAPVGSSDEESEATDSGSLAEGTVAGRSRTPECTRCRSAPRPAAAESAAYSFVRERRRQSRAEQLPVSRFRARSSMMVASAELYGQMDEAQRLQETQNKLARLQVGGAAGRRATLSRTSASSRNVCSSSEACDDAASEEERPAEREAPSLSLSSCGSTTTTEGDLMDGNSLAAEQRDGAGPSPWTSARSARLGNVPKALRIFIGSWNMNGKTCNDQDMASWLTLDGVRAPEAGGEEKTSEEVETERANLKSPPDIVVLGCQEFVALNAQAMLPFASKYPKQDFERLVIAMLSHMHGCRYAPVRVAGTELPPQLVGLLLCVLVKEEHIHGVRGVHCEMVRTGFSGLSGNKGALALRFMLHTTSLCFVNLHLPAGAGPEAKEERNAAMREVMKALEASFASAVVPDAGARLLAPKQHSVLFCFGDLNYRLTLANHDVRRRLEGHNWEELLMHDQLAPQLRGDPGSGPFEGFHEGDLDFRPTYKFDTGTNNYDTSDKQRAPAWTDRVLWCSRKQDLKCLLYSSERNVVTSDHKPVKALFEFSTGVHSASIGHANPRG